MSNVHELDEVKTIPSLKQSYRRLLQIADSEAPALRRSLQFAAISAIMQGLAFASFYPLIDALLAQTLNMNQVWMWMGILSGFALFDWIFCWKAHGFGCSGKIATVTHNIRIKLGLQLRKMPLQTLYQSRTGELSAVIAGNVDEVITPMGPLLEVIIRSSVVPIVVVIATAFVNWQLALSMLLIFPTVIPVYRWIRKASGRNLRALADAHARTSAEIVEYAQGLPVLRAANATGRKSRRLQDALKHLQKTQEKIQLSDIKPIFTLWTLVEGGILVVLAFGVFLILNQTLSIAALVALLIMSVRLSERLAFITNFSVLFDYMEAGFERIEKLLSIPHLPEQQPIQQPQGFDIHFENLTFSYEEGEEPELQQINVTLPERSMTALVGPSGSGKTTLTRMIMRYADPKQGRVLIGDVDIRFVPQDDLMRNISVVFQDVYLFDDTILANIRMGNPEATDEEVENAARAANCHEFIQRLPLRYQTRVGDIGGTLSTGERQRISIARAILKDAPIVMLDEPTAALDTESELAVQKAIDTLVQNRTVIVIAHRLSTIVGADQILVLEDGHLVQSGKHDELVAQTGRYQSMWQAQQQIKNWHIIQHEENPA